jgi:1-acyl-sn-glycerol-3-phosphate acyltransferase
LLGRDSSNRFHVACTFPHGRKLHYWAKSTLFGHPIAKSILLNAGNIPVDRKVRDNQVLFRGTFQALAAGEVVAIFPEGMPIAKFSATFSMIGRVLRH